MASTTNMAGRKRRSDDFSYGNIKTTKMQKVWYKLTFAKSWNYHVSRDTISNSYDDKYNKPRESFFL